MNGGGSNEASGSAVSTAVDDDGPTASDAFQVLANDARTDILRTLAADEPCTFSDLHERSDEDTSAGFAYHLRQLTDRFVRQRDDERYERTHAGREVSRSIQAGTYTDSVDRERVELDEECPHCSRPALIASVADNVTEIRCTDCESPVLALSLPPSGYAAHDAETLPAAIDAYHRRRIATFADGVCPDCGGSVDTGMEAPPEEQMDDHAHGPVQARFECETCGTTMRCPVTLTVLDHPAVVSLFRDHGRDVGDRPIWNVGPEWGERVVSRDPWCVVVSVALDGEALFLYVAGDGTVVDARRHDPDDDVGAPTTTDARTDEVDADAPDDIEAGGESAGADGATV